MVSHIHIHLLNIDLYLRKFKLLLKSQSFSRFQVLILFPFSVNLRLWTTIQLQSIKEHFQKGR